MVVNCIFVAQKLLEIQSDYSMKVVNPVFALSLAMMVSLGMAQNPVLFQVEEEPVHLDEFLYIYEKTNRDAADYSPASVGEYLDLYKKFKLKVYKAKQLHLDTISSLKSELGGYRKQLANTYLSDKEVLESLMREAHQRMQEDVSFSHILLKVAPGADTERENQIYQRAMTVLDRLRAGEGFATVALEVSEDQTVRKNEGKVGFVTALLPDGFYDLETALYTLPKKTYSRPIRSKLGYHIVKVDDRRPARGEIEVAHILIRRSPNAQEKIEQIHQDLEEGADFETLAKAQSEDKRTVANGGYLGFFGINKYESIFENTAFRLREDGAYSRPIQTSIGWHIIKRITKKPIPSYEEVKRTLETKIKKDGRYQVAEKSMLEKIKEENDFREENWNRQKLLDELGENFLSYQWKRPNSFDNQALFSIGDQTWEVEDFFYYTTKNTASRLRIGRSTPLQKALDIVYNDFIADQLRTYEESQLENKYPEFKALMREYAEGILLFEVTKKYVWDRASEDTVGLRRFYEAHADRYKWPEKALIETITIKSQKDDIIRKVKKLMSRKTSQQIIKKMNKKEELVLVQGKLVEKENLSPSMMWKKYAVSEAQQDQGATTLRRLAEIVPRKQKTLEEARGYIIADYQDHLEEKWVKDLMADYTVIVHQEVLDSIIKS